MRQIIVEDGQSLLDITIQEYGKADAIKYLVEDNDIEFDSTLAPGQKLNIRETDNSLADKAIADFFNNKKIKVVSRTVI
jgi:hypothetical protein